MKPILSFSFASFFFSSLLSSSLKRKKKYYMLCELFIVMYPGNKYNEMYIKQS